MGKVPITFYYKVNSYHFVDCVISSLGGVGVGGGGGAQEVMCPGQFMVLSKEHTFHVLKYLGRESS